MAAFFLLCKFPENLTFAAMRKLYSLILISLLISGNAMANGVPVAFKMYPNPMTGDVLQVSFDFEYKSGQSISFVITNVIGQEVYSHNLSEEEMRRGTFTIKLDQIKLDKGIYLTKMINGDHSSVQKLVVR